MVRARPSLMEMMVTERAEAEAWLASEWAPRRRWVIADRDYMAESLDAVAERLSEDAVSEWGEPHLGFVDDGQHEKWERWRQKYDPESEPRKQTAWLLDGESEAAKTFRAHLAPFLREAVERALSSFPLKWAGREIKDALTQSNDYDKEGIRQGFEEVWEGSGPTGLSAGGEDYLELRYHPNQTWMCDVDDWPDSMGAHLWMRYRVLSDDIMAILDAVKAVEDSRG
jgi:hypothetical protein